MKKPNEHVESEALKLHRELYEKRLKSLEELDSPTDGKAPEESSDTEREEQEEALLTEA